MRNSSKLHKGGEKTHDLDWQDARHFAAFVRAGSLSAAAKALGVDHVTVARRLRAFEAAIGAKLVDRRSRIPALTGDGQRIATLVAQMEHAADDVARAGRGLAPTLAGEVSVSAPPTIATLLVAPRLASWRATHPELRVELVGDKRVVSLTRREADIALRLVRPRELGLIARRLGSFEHRLYASKRYLARRERADHEFITYDATPETKPHRDWVEAHAGSRRIALRTNDLGIAIAAACADVGIAVLPTFAAARYPELAPVPSRSKPLVRDVWLVVHDDLRGAPAVRAVIDLLFDATVELRDEIQAKPSP